ncbi:MAG: hypothetical protein EA415_01325 [Sphaerobacteraceae bacterium]|nr:MAG: hypothetical protein EA415_01325 [Sphaerobacteraceae bacterium]
MQEHPSTCNQPAVQEHATEHAELNAAWHEVGVQFQQLGTRLASALRRSWESSSEKSASTETMRHLRDDLREAAERVDHVIREVSGEIEPDTTETLRATRRASEQSLEEARMLTAATLRKLNRQLDHLVQKIERDEHRH